MNGNLTYLRRGMNEEGREFILSTSINERYQTLMTPMASNYSLGSFLFSLDALSKEQEEFLKKGGKIKVKIVEVGRIDPPEEEEN